MILSLVSGKQIYYLLPALPAFAMILARLVSLVDGPVLKHDLLFVIVGTIGMGILPLIANHFPHLPDTRLRDLVADWYAMALMACGAALALFKFRQIQSAVFAVGTAAVLFFVILIISMKSTIWIGFELRPLAGLVANHKGGVAWFGGYHGQLNYLGGVRYVQEIEEAAALPKWLSNNPGGLLVVRLSTASASLLENAGIDPANSVRLSSIQREQITQIVRADAEFPGHDLEPTVMQLYWIRRGLPLDPFAVVRFDNPPRTTF